MGGEGRYTFTLLLIRCSRIYLRYAGQINRPTSLAPTSLAPKLKGETVNTFLKLKLKKFFKTNRTVKKIHASSIMLCITRRILWIVHVQHSEYKLDVLAVHFLAGPVIIRQWRICYLVYDI